MHVRESLQYLQDSAAEMGKVALEQISGAVDRRHIQQADGLCFAPVHYPEPKKEVPCNLDLY